MEKHEPKAIIESITMGVVQHPDHGLPVRIKVGNYATVPGSAVKQKIVDIRYTEDNYGDHGVAWFDVYVEGMPNRPIASMNVRHTAFVEYLYIKDDEDGKS